MKKLVLFATAIIAISFASCTNKANTEATPAGDSTVVTAPVDTTVTTPVDTTAAPVDSAKVAKVATPEAKK